MLWFSSSDYITNNGPEYNIGALFFLHTDPFEHRILASESALYYLFARFSRQNAVVGVHREKKQRRIVLKRTAVAGF